MILEIVFFIIMSPVIVLGIVIVALPFGVALEVWRVFSGYYDDAGEDD